MSVCRQRLVFGALCPRCRFFVKICGHWRKLYRTIRIDEKFVYIKFFGIMTSFYIKGYLIFLLFTQVYPLLARILFFCLSVCFSIYRGNMDSLALFYFISNFSTIPLHPRRPICWCRREFSGFPCTWGGHQSHWISKTFGHIVHTFYNMVGIVFFIETLGTCYCMPKKSCPIPIATFSIKINKT